MSSVVKTWSGTSFQPSPMAWIGEIEYDVAYVTDAKAAVDAVYDSQGYSRDQNAPSSYPGVPLMYLQDMVPRQEGFGHYIVTARFSTSQLGIVPNPSDPLNTAEIYSFQIGSSQEAVDQDAYGGAIINTVGAPLVGATRNFAVLTLIVERNEPIFNPTVALQYVNHVNSKAMKFLDLFVANPGMALLRNYQPMQQITTKSPYVRCQYQIDFRQPVASAADADGLWDSWKTRIANKSRIGCYKDASDNIKQGFFGRGSDALDFVETSEEILIDSFGIPIPMPGMQTDWKIRDTSSSTVVLRDPVKVPSQVNKKVAIDTDPTTGAVFLKFCMFPPVDLGGLNL